MSARRPDSRRARRAKLAVAAAIVVGAAGSALLGLQVLGQVYPRVTVVQEQASALNLARRPEPVPLLRWQPPAPGAAVDGVTAHDLRQAYVLAHAELTYARRSGDTTGLPGVFTGEALAAARAAGRGLLLDWDHVARLRHVTRAGAFPADGDLVQLRDESWVATARPENGRWTDVVVARRTLDVTLRRADGRWRVAQLRAAGQTQPEVEPVRAPDVAAWRALAVPAAWPTWTARQWDAQLRAVRRAGAGPLLLPLDRIPTRAQLSALTAAVARARAAGVGVVPAFSTPLTLETVPLRAQVAARVPPGTLALDPGAVDPADPGSVAAVRALRLAAPTLPLVAGVGSGPDVAQALRAGVSAVVTADPAVAAAHPDALLRVPRPGRLPAPWRRRAVEAALDAAGARGGWRADLTDVLGLDGQLTARGARLLPRTAP